MQLPHTDFSFKRPIRSSTHLVALAALLLGMTSCVANILTPYYFPSAPGGAVSRALQPGTNSIITFERDGVVVGVHVRIQLESIEALLSFEIPDHKTVRLLTHHLEVFESPNKVWNSELTGSIWTRPGRTTEFPVDSDMIGKSRAWKLGIAKGLGETKHAAFFFAAPLFSKPGPSSFAIQPPRFQVNDAEVELPRIEFTFDQEKLWTPLM
jgi:hypothetical protein